MTSDKVVPIKRYRHYIPQPIISHHDKTKIVIIGAGGTGSKIITDIAQMHVALMTLGHAGLSVHAVDDDIVSEANIGRQLFSPVDIGRNKAEVLVTRANNFFGLDWRSYPIRIDKQNAKEIRADIIITAVDNPETRILIAKHSNAHYWIDTGNTRNSGQVILGTLGEIQQPKKFRNTASKLPHAADLYPDMAKQEKKAIQGPSCSLEQALERQDLFINRFVASCAVEIIWKMFRYGHLDIHGAFIDTKTLNIRPMPIDPDMWARMGYVPRQLKQAA